MSLFGDRLLELRQSYGWTQQQLGILLDVSHSTVAQWERGRNEPNVATVMKIAAYFDVSTDYLLGKTETKPTTLPQVLRMVESGKVTDPQGNPLAQKDKQFLSQAIHLLVLKHQTQKGSDPG